ncbi:MAG: hypothetical protein SWO11_01900 [Thermodesulfobacteriota bacterium]|nr:hypothetical protein [Thermodesulfobacteriota bacterium]
MAQYLSAKEFRQRIPRISEDLKKWGEIIVLKKSKPQFKVVPFEEVPLDLLDRAAAIQDPAQPDLQDIAGIVHKIREMS